VSEDRYAPIFEAPVKKLNFVNGQFEFSWNGRWFKTLEAAQAAQTVAFQELRDRGVDVAERLGEVEARYTAHIAEMDEVIKAAVDSGDWSNVPADVIRHKAIGIIVSSLPYVAKRKVSHEIEFISAECVYGMHFFKDVFAGIRDFWGGEKCRNTEGLARRKKSCNHRTETRGTIGRRRRGARRVPGLPRNDWRREERHDHVGCGRNRRQA